MAIVRPTRENKIQFCDVCGEPGHPPKKCTVFKTLNKKAGLSYETVVAFIESARRSNTAYRVLHEMCDKFNMTIDDNITLR